MINPRIAEVLGQFQPISLAEMEDSALLERVDTKFILTEQQLAEMLANISHAYRVLEIKNVRLFQYRTLYFDTLDFALYRQHHSGKRNRHKIRFRCYEDSGLAFLETKFKVSEDRTIKTRIKVPEIVRDFDDPMQQFLHKNFPIGAEKLTPHREVSNAAAISLCSASMAVGHVACVTARPSVAEILSRPSKTTVAATRGVASEPGTTVAELLRRRTAPTGSNRSHRRHPRGTRAVPHRIPPGGQRRPSRNVLAPTRPPGADLGRRPRDRSRGR